MKSELNYKSKRAFVVVAILALLATTAGISAYFFTKGNNKSGATIVDQNVQGSNNQESATPVADNKDENKEQNNSTETNNELAQNIENGTEQNKNTENISGQNSTNNISETKTSVSSANSTKVETSTNVNSVVNNNDATTVYENVEENIVVESPWEAHMVEWTPEKLRVVSSNVKDLTVKQQNISVNKKAVTSTGYNLVSVGDKITYNITVTNNEDKVLNSLYITDKIPEGTKFVSIEENGEVIKDEEVVTSVVWNLWNLGLNKGESTTVSFTVEVIEEAKNVKTIKNTAYTEGLSSEETTENAVLNNSKTSKINGEETTKAARIGDKIEYTISVENMGEIDGETLVKDADLEKILENGKAELVGDITVYENDTEKEVMSKETLVETGYVANVKANTTLKIVFTVEVKRIDGKIVNTALIGGNDSENVNDEVETANIEVEKTIVSEPEDGKAFKLGETVTFKVVVKNTGSVTLTNITIEDDLPEAVTSDNTVIESLAYNESKTLIYYYTIQEPELSCPCFTNVATAIGTDSTNPGKEVIAEGESERIVLEERYADFEVEKTSNIDENAKVSVGDTIVYTIKLTNKGNVTLNNIMVNDSMFGKKTTVVNKSDKYFAKHRGVVVKSLAPREENAIEITYSHVVKADDIESCRRSESVVYNKVVVNCDNPLNPNSPFVKEDENRVNANNKCGYTIEYYFDNEKKPSTVKVMPKVRIGSIIRAVPTPAIDGYILDSSKGINGVIGTPLKITADERNNVIKVYYVKAKYSYTINYYKDSISNENFITKIEGTESFGQTITANTKYEVPVGYRFKGTAPSIVINKNDNVINVVYVKDCCQNKTISYTVEYYLNGVIDNSKTVVDSKKVWVNETNTTLTVDQSKINTKDAFENAVFEKTNPESIPTVVNNGDVIRVYYKQQSLYTVTYNVNNEKVKQFTNIVPGSTHSVLGDSEIGFHAPEGYVFAGTWHDDNGNVYVAGDKLKVDSNINLYADFKTIHVSQKEAESIGWQSKITNWGPSIKNVFYPATINGNPETQVFYCRQDSGEIELITTGHIVSIYDETKGEDVVFEGKGSFKLYVGHSYVFNLNQRNIKVVHIDVKKY